MNFKLSNLVAATLAGSMLMGFGVNAMADSTTDIVNALVAKGVLTEEEGALLTKGRTDEAAGQAKALKKAGKVSVSDAIDNATVYGDIRARYEMRDGDVLSATPSGLNTESDRARYKITLGVETKSGNLYSDIAFSMGDNGRSDNTSFGDVTTGNAYDKSKGAIFVKRAMIGWKATDWLAIEVGKMKNPLYMVSAMAFDHDIVFDGAQEKFNYKLGETNLFANLGQWVYTGKEVASTNGGASTTSRQNMVLAFQGGVQQAFADNLSAKAAIGYYDYTANSSGVTANYIPTKGNLNTTASFAVNDLAILDIPVEVNYMVTPNIGVKPYAQYAYNTKGSDRKAAAGATVAALANDDTAWLVGISVGSAKDLKSFEGKKMAKNDWNANLWYQSVGTYALDQNSVDSDIFDGRLNMEGTVLKAQYMAQDNVALNFTGGWGKRKNSEYGTNAPKVDIAGNIDNYSLYQFDVTYKF